MTYLIEILILIPFMICLLFFMPPLMYYMSKYGDWYLDWIFEFWQRRGW